MCTPPRNTSTYVCMHNTQVSPHFSLPAVIAPDDHSRVVLSERDSTGSDYINGAYIDVSDQQQTSTTLLLCKHTHTHACTHTRTHAHTHTHTHTHTTLLAFMHTCMHVRIYTHTQVYAHAQ